MTFNEEYILSEPNTAFALREYETYLLNEITFIREVSFIKGPDFADYDYEVIVNGKSHHYIEVKGRRNDFEDYPDVKMPLRKHTFAEHIFNATKKKGYFLGLFNDNLLAICNITKEPDAVKSTVARRDRGEQTDLYAYYNLDKFTTLWNK